MIICDENLQTSAEGMPPFGTGLLPPKGPLGRLRDRALNGLVDRLWNKGLPELNREPIQADRYVASPGCFATTIELALLPLARAGLLSGTIHVVAATGSSGSGAAAQAGTHHPVRAVNLKTYNERSKPPIDPGTKARLAEYYRPFNEALYERLGRDMRWG